MITRDDVLSRAADDCMKELYSLAYPKVKWEDFVEQNKIYTNAYKEWEKYKEAERENKELFEEYNKKLDWKDKTITECIGPRPYEFYFLPKEIMKDICDNYIHAYKINDQQDLLDIITILKNYCKEPIIDKWIEGENGFPGHRGYEHPDNLEREVTKILVKYDDSMDSEQGEEIVNKFFEFLDMAGNFYNWNRDLNAFTMTVYLGASPNSNKESVIENWKKYKGVDISIDEEQMKKDFYGEELD